MRSEIQHYQSIFSNCADFVVRRFSLCGTDFALLYLDNVTDREYTCAAVIDPLVKSYDGRCCPADCITTADLKEAKDRADAIGAIVNGGALLLYTGCNVPYGYIAAVRNEGGRSIAEPDTENVVRGPREGFIESAPANAVLIRRRLKTPDLKYEEMTVGTVTETKVILMYLDSLVNRRALAILKERLAAIKTDAVLDSGYVEAFISDGKLPFFPSVGNSERPDKVAGKLLEGRIALFCDGSPVALTVPFLCTEALQSTEDYVKTTYYATFIRILRSFSLLLAIYLPAFFCAVMYFHQSFLPLSLLIKVQTARKDLSFSLFAELFLILIAFEIIREVGIRMPRTVGDAVSIVAGLILSDSAVAAGIASAPVIIVVAIAAICNFILPPFMNQNSLLRLIVLIAARLMGFFGIALFTLLFLLLLVTKKSFSVPYMSPLSPFSAVGMQDFIFMAPLRRMRQIPPSVSGKKAFRRGRTSERSRL